MEVNEKKEIEISLRILFLNKKLEDIDTIIKIDGG